jgi:hypothetical protein
MDSFSKPTRRYLLRWVAVGDDSHALRNRTDQGLICS